MADEADSNSSAEAADDALSVAIAVLDQVRARARQRPYTTLAAAAGVGYVLGGGLFTRSTGLAVRWVFQLTSLPPVRAYLVSLALRATRDLEAPTSPSE